MACLSIFFEKDAEITKILREKLSAPPSKAVVGTTEEVTILFQGKIRFTIGPFYLGDRLMIFRYLYGVILCATIHNAYDVTISCKKRILQFPDFTFELNHIYEQESTKQNILIKSL